MTESISEAESEGSGLDISGVSGADVGGGSGGGGSFSGDSGWKKTRQTSESQVFPSTSASRDVEMIKESTMKTNSVTTTMTSFVGDVSKSKLGHGTDEDSPAKSGGSSIYISSSDSQSTPSPSSVFSGYKSQMHQQQQQQSQSQLNRQSHQTSQPDQLHQHMYQNSPANSPCPWTSSAHGSSTNVDSANSSPKPHHHGASAIKAEPAAKIQMCIRYVDGYLGTLL